MHFTWRIYAPTKEKKYLWIWQTLSKIHSLILCYLIIKQGAGGNPSSQVANHTLSTHTFVVSIYSPFLLY